jgi:succinate dehydrogenase/fumarate reductase flavoprotein subunit
MAITEASVTTTRDLRADAIVIGAGASGLCAALTLSFGGASVLIFEEMPECGGMTNHAEGMFAVESKLQKKDKVGLNVDDAFRVHMEETHWLANARLVKSFMEQSGPTIDWLEELGAQFSGLYTISPYTPRVWHQFVGFARVGLIGPLKARADAEENIGLFLETPVKRLLMDGGRAAGVVAEDKHGATINARARVVIVASGGYQDNEEWVNKYCKSGFTRPVVPANQVGGPIQMAWDVGAEPYDLGVMQTIVLVPEEELTCQLLVAGYQPRLWINLLGERFCDESICWKFPMAGNALARQPNATAFCLFDENTKTQMREHGVEYVLGEFYDISQKLADLDEELERGEKAEKVFRADSLADLAGSMGVSESQLLDAVDEYNQCCSKNYDFVFGKDRKYLQPIDTPSFYAVKLGLAAFMTNGGIRINHKTEVLTKEREAIPGLYAVGCCAGGLLGDTYEVSTTGGSLSFAVNSGRIAGKNALEYLAGL